MKTKVVKCHVSLKYEHLNDR